MPPPTRSPTRRRSQPTDALRYAAVHERKARGATYTPRALADFVATRIVRGSTGLERGACPRVLDPAVGDGALLESLLRVLASVGVERASVVGFDPDTTALTAARKRLADAAPCARVELRAESFLSRAAGARAPSREAPGSRPVGPPVPGADGYVSGFDLVIANPPYVRTQVLGAKRSQQLARRFGLTGRVDLYHAFLIAIAAALAPGGLGGIIVSNRLMTTRAGASVRRELQARTRLRHVWDLGDTRLFDAAVLPAVLLLEPAARVGESPGRSVAFTSIYSAEPPIPRHDTATREVASRDEDLGAADPASAVPSAGEPVAADPIEALAHEGAVTTRDGRRFVVRHGQLDTGARPGAVWRLVDDASRAWLDTVARNTWRRFGDIGKIRVGIKSCADRIFIRSDWDALAHTLGPGLEAPELLRPITTHHDARPFRARAGVRRILYPHTGTGPARRAVDLAAFPASRRYLELHRAALERRCYVIAAGRQWYELWVPQDPEGWSGPKLVFRDISARPEFWIDPTGSVVNGDCYWLARGAGAPGGDELLWLAAAVANTSFIEQVYDRAFNNKLYAGRRRFITQYVEQFPLPDPAAPDGQRLIALARALYARADETEDTARLRSELEATVRRAFGVDSHATTGAGLRERRSQT